VSVSLCMLCMYIEHLNINNLTDTLIQTVLQLSPITQINNARNEQLDSTLLAEANVHSLPEDVALLNSKVTFVGRGAVLNIWNNKKDGQMMHVVMREGMVCR
jgi:hypothetical protein